LITRKTNLANIVEADGSFANAETVVHETHRMLVMGGGGKFLAWRYITGGVDDDERTFT